MSRKLELSSEWVEYSDLSITEAAYILYGLDPKAHFVRYGQDERYTKGFDERCVQEEIEENYAPLRSALRTGKLVITEGNASDIDFHKIHITKDSFIVWCKEIHRTDVVSAFNRASISNATCAKETTKLVRWKDEARRIADEEFDRDTANRTRDSLENYSKRVMYQLQEMRIHGPRGRIDNPKTIQREALQADKWWAGKKK